MNCQHCGAAFTPNTKRQLYCSADCRNRYHHVPKNSALWRHNRNEQMHRMRQQGTRWKVIAHFFGVTTQTAQRAVRTYLGQNNQNRQDGPRKTEGLGKEKRL